MSWLNSMPARWELRSPKALFGERRTPNLPEDVHLTPSQKYGVLPQSEYVERTGGSVVLNLAGQDKMKHVEKNDFIIHLRSFQGGLERAHQAGKVSSAYTVVEPKPLADPGYYGWMLKSSAFIQELQTTTNQLRDGQSIRWTDFIKVPLPTPSLGEQRAIAAYLDRETQRIDELIAEQRGLIDTLRERRIAMISRLTGWNTEVHPEWPLRRLSHLFERTASGTTPANEDIIYDDSGIPWVNTGELRETAITSTRKSVSSETLDRYSALAMHPPGSLLIAMYGATIGRMGILTVPATTNQACCALIGPRDASAQFVMYSLLAGQEQLLLSASGGGQPNINQAKVRGFKIPTPPLHEQESLVVELDDQTSRIDALIAESEDLIELSLERRAALTTAAVTGQIDVRTTA